MDQLVNAVETASGPVYTEARYAAVQLEGTTRDERVQSLWRVLRANARRRSPRAGDDGDAAAEVLAMARDAVLSDAEREEQIRELRAEARRATAQSEIEENARRWLETAGDVAAAQIARASAFAEGGFLDPSDFAAAPDSPPTPPPSRRLPASVRAEVRDDDVQTMQDHPGGLEAAMAELFAGLPPTLQDSSSDSESTEGSEDSDSSDSSGDEPRFGAVTEPRVEADL